ncbi:hypothetical protein [Pseudomonas sp. CC6-YY-74]|uniref:hypothetical protein n=1 Tax=Pseudomonas sp. CC6-YY-74 TaxID=1930532 RepID=UPI0009A24A90|nr:hypothetical protein [Pseudomonas sp. CC6-YY-74]
MDMEFFTNPSGWPAIFWALAVGTTIKAIGARLPALTAQWMGLAKGRLRLWYWRSCRKKLLRIKEANCDALLITREISRSAVYLTLFFVSVSMWLPLSLMILYIVPGAVSWPKLIIWIGALPIYFFEICWVVKSKFLDDLFLYRKRISQRGARQITKKTKKLIALSTRTKSAEPLPAAQQKLPI